MEKKYVDLISKNKKNKKKERKSYSEKEKALAMCDHKNQKANVSFLEMVNKDKPEITVCEKCGTKVDTSVIDQRELLHSTDVVKNSLQCIKFAKKDITTEQLKAIAQVLLILEDLPYQYKINYADLINKKLLNESNEKDSDDDDDENDVNGPQFLFTSQTTDGCFINNNRGKKSKKKNKKNKKKRKGYFSV